MYIKNTKTEYVFETNFYLQYCINLIREKNKKIMTY